MSTFGSTHDVPYVLTNLIAKDFKIRYRNMSLGVFWSLVNPLVMMSVMTFIFTFIMPSPEKHFPLFLLMGLLPYNFFSLAWSTGTTSIVDNADLVTKVPFPRALIPVAGVFANVLHYLIQLSLLLLVTGIVIGFSLQWLWLPVVLLLQILFVCGLSLCCSALDVYYRDTRYVVESATVVLFWIVPIFYSFATVEKMAQDFPFLRTVMSYNPIAATIFSVRQILLHGGPPAWGTLTKLAGVSLLVLILGFLYFRRVERDFADYL